MKPLEEISVAGLRDVVHERDLESQTTKKVPEVTVAAIDSPDRPALGRRKTTGSLNGLAAGGTDTLGYEGDEDALTKIGNFLWKIHSASVLTRYALYILPVAALLAIPLVLTATVYSDARADGIRLLGLFIYIEIIWKCNGSGLDRMEFSSLSKTMASERRSHCPLRTSSRSTRIRK